VARRAWHRPCVKIFLLPWSLEPPGSPRNVDHCLYLLGCAGSALVIAPSLTGFAYALRDQERTNSVLLVMLVAAVIAVIVALGSPALRANGHKGGVLNLLHWLAWPWHFPLPCGSSRSGALAAG